MPLDDFSPHPLPVLGGLLAVSPMPGRTRHYRTDWDTLVGWGPRAVLTMTKQAELERKGAGSLGADCTGLGIAWHHLPVADFGAPTPEVEALWPEVSRDLRAHLSRGNRVLVHCFGGCGRSGMAALRLMVDAGEAPAAALTLLREARPCAVETEAQLAWATKGALP